MSIIEFLDLILLKMNYINNHSAEYGVTVKYVTLSEYFDIVMAQNITWGVYTYVIMILMGTATGTATGTGKRAARASV
jgi:uncharacterized membrane protein (DUF441 family)